MKKSLLVILIVAVLFGTLFVCCFEGNGQLANAENVTEQAAPDACDANAADDDGLDDYFGLPSELEAQLVNDLNGEGLSFKAGDRRVYLYAVISKGKPAGVLFGGLYFGVSGIEVTVEVYSSPAFTIDFKINAKKGSLTDEQLANRNKLIDLFGRISQMIDDVDDCANTTYDGANSLGITSDVYRYNEAKKGDKVDVSYYTYDMLRYARKMYEDTNGAFNPAVYRLVDLWGFSSRTYFKNGNLPYDRKWVSREYPLPEQKYVEAFSNPSFTDFSENAVKLTDNGDGTYSITKNVAAAVVDGIEFQQWIDLGGIAKGYAVDLARAKIKELGIDRFFINAGMSSIAAGYEDGGGNTDLGILNAFDSDVLCEVKIGKSSISTSGQNVRRYTVDGVEYAHILDGVTGAPAQTGVRSVMVVVPEEAGPFWATMGDCLTTALTVMGREKIVEFANGFLKENGIKIVVQYQTLDGRKQLLSNYRQDELTGFSESFPEFGWALKVDDDGNFYYDADAKFSNPKNSYTALLAVLGSILGVGAVGLIVYHFLRGRRRVATNVVNAKKDKPFKVLDVMLYLGVILLILVLFYVFIFDTDTKQMETITVLDFETGETLFMYNVTRNEYAVNDGNANGWTVEVKRVDDGLEVTLTREINGDNHFNTVKITRGTSPSVKMIDSLCGDGQDCIYNFRAVTRSGGTIVCSPNRLKVITQ